MSEIVAGSRVMVRIEAEAEDREWPNDCASFADVFGDIDGPDDGFEAGTVIRVDEDGSVPIALVVWDGLADASEDADGDGMPAVWAWRVPCFALMPHGSCRSRWERLVDPVRQIATIIGCPANADPLTDLDGLVSMVRGLAERAETVRVVTADRDALAAETDARIADAVAAERHAMGVWLRNPANWGEQNIASAIEHGDHIEQDESITAEPAPPLPSLRLTLAANRMLLKKVATLEARMLELEAPGECASLHKLRHERDQWRGRAVMDGWLGLWVMKNGMPNDSRKPYREWLASDERARLLAHIGADVLAEVER